MKELLLGLFALAFAAFLIGWMLDTVDNFGEDWWKDD